jgi:hypothetical protein
MSEPRDPQPIYPQQGYAPVQVQPPKGMAIAAMVLGIVGLVLAFIPVVGVVSFVLGPLAVILGIIAFVKRRGRGQAIAGIVTGAIAFVVAIVGLVLTGALFSAIDEEMQNLEDIEGDIEDAAEEAGETDADVEEIEEEVTEEEQPAEETSGEWIEVATLSGTGDQRGEVFTIEGDARITYEFNAADEDFAIGAVYVVQEGDTLEDQGGIPEMMPDGTEAGETMFYRTGNFYFDVTAANYDSWTVTIEEQQ